MRTILRDNSLSVVMFGLFGLCLLGHSLAMLRTTTTSRPISNPPSSCQNWQSEFLAVGTVVVSSI